MTEENIPPATLQQSWLRELAGGESWVKPDGLVEATLPGSSLECDLLGEGKGSKLGGQCPKIRSSQDKVPTKSDHSSAPRASRTDLESP